MTARQLELGTNALLPFALVAGVSFGSGSVFDPRGLVSPSLRLNFTVSPPDILQEGVRRLIRAAREFAALQAAAKQE
jgi:2-aminoadipate transaminase